MENKHVQNIRSKYSHYIINGRNAGKYIVIWRHVFHISTCCIVRICYQFCYVCLYHKTDNYCACVVVAEQSSPEGEPLEELSRVELCDLIEEK